MIAIIRLALLIATTAPSTQQSISIHHAEASVQRIIFDPQNAPREMPTLNPNEAALTQFHFDCRVRVDADGRVSINLALDNQIFLPQKVSGALREHEEGHRVINERIYGEIVEETARKEVEHALMRNVDGAEIELHLARALREAFVKEANRAGEKFDQITAHGRADVRIVDAIEAALKK